VPTQQETTFLLGAGASVDAGIPATYDLTNAIVREVEEDAGGYRSPAVQALNMALGAVIAHDTARGGGVYDGVDVERLFSAVQMLGQRGDLEIAPFVERWNPGLESLGPPRVISPFFEREFRRALDGQGGLRAVGGVIEQAVRDLTGDSNSDHVFKDLERAMVKALRGCLSVSQGSSDYLVPLLRSGGSAPVRLATLNYDRTVEVAASSAELDVATGIELWEGGLQWAFEAVGDVNLLKLHGSIDWSTKPDRGTHGRFADRKIAVSDETDLVNMGYGELAVVFGQRGKLRSGGPFLAMLNGFERFLAASTRLVVIGYSFRDDHINELIRQWFNKCDRPAVTIIDPALKAEDLFFAGRGPFLQELLVAMSARPMDGPGLPQLAAGHELIKATARDGIARLVGS